MSDREYGRHTFLHYTPSLLLAQGMATTINRVLVLATLLLCSARPLRAQVCVGDCDGGGRPTVDELVRGVNILLERAALTVCPTLDINRDGKVAVNELVRAVADILYGCGVNPPTPAASLTPTVTATPTSSPALTPTATNTQRVPDIAGEWREDQYHLASSTCIESINALLDEFIDALPACVYTVEQNGLGVTITDCDGIEATGGFVETDTVLIDLPENDLVTQDGCTLLFDPEFRGNLSSSPTTVQQTLDLSFSGSCDLEPCRIVVSSRWTRL